MIVYATTNISLSYSPLPRPIYKIVPCASLREGGRPTTRSHGALSVGSLANMGIGPTVVAKSCTS